MKQAIIGIGEFEGVFGRTVINRDGDFLTSIGIGRIEDGEVREIRVVPPLAG